MRIQLPGRLLRFGSRRRRISQKRQSHTASASAQIQCLDSRVLLSAVTGGTAVFTQSETANTFWGGDAVLADFDGDGDVDAFHEIGYLQLNDGAGNFNLKRQHYSAPGSSDFAVADLDGDGDLDVFSVNQSGFANTILINDGLGHFSIERLDVGTGRMHAVDLGDLDGDGDFDAVIVGPDGPGFVLLNDGTGTFTDSGATVGAGGDYHVQLSDVDGDGALDAILNYFGRARIWRNQGDGSFVETNQYIGGSSIASLLLDDLDGDGDVDALWSSTRNDLGAEVWLNNGAGVFSRTTQQLGNLNYAISALGDLDGDGDLDAVVAFANRNEGPKVWLNDGAAHFTDSGQILGGEPFRGIDLADLDGDGDIDIWSGVSREESVWLNQNQTIQYAVDLPDPGEPFETYFEVIVDAEDLVVRQLRRELGVTELFRQPQSDVPRLLINGTDGDDRLIVNFSGGNPIPVSGLEFNAGEESNGDSLIIGSGSVSSVSHTFSSHSDGSVIIDGALLTYTGVEPVTDNLSADRRYFSFSGATDTVQLNDNGTEADGISQISGSGRVLEFPSPSTRLKINGSRDNDVITLSAMDALFTGGVSVDVFLGNDSVIAEALNAPLKLFGTDGLDTLIGGMQDDLLDGGYGNDVLNGRGGNDVLLSGDGDDLLFGGSGHDLLDGLGGDDRLFGQGGNGDTLIGGYGIDTFDGGAGRDLLIGRVSQLENITILTDSEVGFEREIELTSGIEMIQMDHSSDNFSVRIDASAFSGSVTLRGGSADDTLIGGSGDDSLDGGGGNDSLSGGDGNDWLDGGDGDDTLNGGDGNDSLTGGFGNDAIAGMSGNDWLNGNRDNDTLLGGDGDDTLLGGGQDDTLLGEAGDDFIKGHDGEDLVSGGGQGASASAGDTVDGENIDDAFTLDAPWAAV